jgi:XTP/dITP diphosphohydrolase
MKVNYVTGNEIKIKYANQKLNRFGIEVVQVRLDIDEIQSHDKLGVAIHKAKQAYEQIKQPLFVTDTFWEIPALNGFPGAFMKYVNEWFVAQDFLNLMKGKRDRRIFCHDSIVYIDEQGIKSFEDVIEGEIAEEIYEDGEELNSVDNVVKFEGKYLKEHHKENWGSLKENKNWNNFAEFLKRSKYINVIHVR